MQLSKVFSGDLKPEQIKIPSSVMQQRKCPIITKTYLYNTDPLKPHLYVVKLGFTEVYMIFLFSAKKHRSWVFVWTASARRFPQSMFWAEIWKISEFFIFHFWVVKFSIYLNRRVFVMDDFNQYAYPGCWSESSLVRMKTLCIIGYPKLRPVKILHECEVWSHNENTPIQIYWKFHHQKNWKFSDKVSDIFFICLLKL